MWRPDCFIWNGCPKPAPESAPRWRRCWPGVAARTSGAESHYARLGNYRFWIRLPFLFGGLMLGASLWYVARRLYGNMGGYVALGLYCFSPLMVGWASQAGAVIVGAWGAAQIAVSEGNLQRRHVGLCSAGNGRIRGSGRAYSRFARARRKARSRNTEEVSEKFS